MVRETGLYYLQSRYYNPEWGRFLNADALVSTGQGQLGNNMFAYCNNNPVNGYDPAGTFGLIAGIIVAGALVGGLMGAFSAAVTGNNVLESVIEGCFTGAIGAACGLLIANPVAAVGIAVLGGMAVDFTTQVTTQYVEKQDINLREIDYVNVIRTGVLTGLGTAVPAFGNAKFNAVDACGTIIIWGEASVLITCADIAITKCIEAQQTSASNDTVDSCGMNTSNVPVAVCR